MPSSVIASITRLAVAGRIKGMSPSQTIQPWASAQAATAAARLCPMPTDSSTST